MLQHVSDHRGSIIRESYTVLGQNYKNHSIVSVDMDKVGVMAAYTHTHTHTHRVTICCHNTDLVHVNGHNRIILVIFSQALYKAP